MADNAVITMVIGDSGSGKTFTLYGLITAGMADKTLVVNVTGKPFPFKNKKIKSVSSDDIDQIISWIKSAYEKGYRRFIIDDANYTMVDMFMAKAFERGYDKFNIIGKKFFDLINFIRTLPGDATVYVMMHTEACEDGKTRAKTIGKMLNDKVTLEGLFTIVLLAQTDGKKHVLVTQSDGTTTAKSPIDMFDTEIPNDLGFVDRSIREYYDLPLFLDEEADNAKA